MNDLDQSSRLTRISLGLTALVFLGIGLVFLVYPDFISTLGVRLESGTARTEIRGFYGGFEVGLGIFFALSVTRRRWHSAGLAAQIAAFAGMALGRVVGVALDGLPDPMIFVLMSAETLGAGVGVWAWLAAGSPRH